MPEKKKSGLWDCSDAIVCPYMGGLPCAEEQCGAHWMVQLDEDGKKVGEGCSHSLYPQQVYQTLQFQQELLDRLDRIEEALLGSDEEYDDDDPEEVVDNMEQAAPQEED